MNGHCEFSDEAFGIQCTVRCVSNSANSMWNQVWLANFYEQQRTVTLVKLKRNGDLFICMVFIFYVNTDNRIPTQQTSFIHWLKAATPNSASFFVILNLETTCGCWRKVHDYTHRLSYRVFRRICVCVRVIKNICRNKNTSKFDIFGWNTEQLLRLLLLFI